MKLFRITSGGKGIYERVDELCSRDDPRRRDKPDGSWVEKAGVRFPGSTSYWTEVGFRRYKESGLFDWHVSIVGDDITVEQIDRPNTDTCVVYEDSYQVLINHKG